MVLSLALSLTLLGCGDPQKIRFVDLCSDNGYSQGQCSCVYETLEEDVDDIDDEYVNFWPTLPNGIMRIMAAASTVPR